MSSIHRIWLVLGVVAVLLQAACMADPTEISPSQTHVPTNTPFPSITDTPVYLPTTTPAQLEFIGERAYQDVVTQLNFGPRLPGSQAHAQTIAWIEQELVSNNWKVDLQETTYHNQFVRNIIAKRGTDNTPWIILGAHYDSRFFADHDPNADNHNQPVPGANDGASGVAVLLELARVLPEDPGKQIWLVFFDAEDQGNIPEWDWILGSSAFAETLTGMPEAVIVIDMIGDADLNIPKERNSDQGLVAEIWAVAAERGYANIFQAQPGYAMLDDHTPFLKKGVKAIDIIDFDYAYWHTVEDTADKVSAESLHTVGDTLLHWLLYTD